MTTIRSSRSSFAAALFLTAIALPACARQTPILVGGCSTKAEGTAELLLRPELDTSDNTQRSDFGSLAVLVTTGTDRREPLAAATIRLRKPGPSSDTTQIAAQNTDTTGRTRLDSLVAGGYDALIRRIGFETFRSSVSVRAGRTDTVYVRLRTAALCYGF